MIARSLTCIFTFLLFVVLSGMSPVAVSAEPNRQGRNETYRSAAENPQAIIKQGFLIRLQGGFASFSPIDSSRIDRYRLDPGCVAIDNQTEIPLKEIPSSAIVELILIEGQVHEIILLARPS